MCKFEPCPCYNLKQNTMLSSKEYAKQYKAHNLYFLEQKDSKVTDNPYMFG